MVQAFVVNSTAKHCLQYMQANDRPAYSLLQLSGVVFQCEEPMNYQDYRFVKRIGSSKSRVRGGKC